MFLVDSKETIEWVTRRPNLFPGLESAIEIRRQGLEASKSGDAFIPALHESAAQKAERLTDSARR